MILNTSKCLVNYMVIYMVSNEMVADQLKWTVKKWHAANYMLEAHHAILAMSCFIWDIKQLRIDDNHDDLTSSRNRTMAQYKTSISSACAVHVQVSALLWFAIQISNQKHVVLARTHDFLVAKFVFLVKCLPNPASIFPNCEICRQNI